MRTSSWTLVAVLISAVLPGSAYGQSARPEPTEVDSNSACIQRLEIPRYPPLATQARMEATITVDVLIGQGGTAKQVDTTAESRSTQGKALLGAAVWKVISEAKFRPECAGKTVKAVFHFNLTEISPIYTR